MSFHLTEEKKEILRKFAEEYIEGVDVFLKEDRNHNVYCTKFLKEVLNKRGFSDCPSCPLSQIYNGGTSQCGSQGSFLERKEKMKKWLSENISQFEFEF